MSGERSHDDGQERLRRIAFALVVFSAACQESEGLGRSDTIALYVPRDEVLPADTVELIEDTFEMEISMVSQGYGAVTVFLFDEEAGGLAGENAGSDYCSAALWSTRRPEIIAHEIGHALGLEHVDNPSNLMFPGENDGELAPEQIDTARLFAWFHEECREEPRTW